MRYLKDKDDGFLVNAFRQGNNGAFNVLFHRHKNRIAAVIYYTVKDRFLTEDLLQEVFIRIVQSIKNDRYIHEGKFIQWASVMAKNHSIDHARKIKRQPVVFCDAAVVNNLPANHSVQENPGPEDFCISELMSAIRRLPAGQVEVVQYRIVHGLSFKEIASLMDTSINTAIGRMRYGIINLRKAIVPETDKCHSPEFFRDSPQKR